MSCNYLIGVAILMCDSRNHVCLCRNTVLPPSNHRLSEDEYAKLLQLNVWWSNSCVEAATQATAIFDIANKGKRALNEGLE